MTPQELETMAQKISQYAHELAGSPIFDVSDEAFASYIKQGKFPPGFQWAYIQAQQARLSQPRTFVPWSQGVIPGQAGDNTNWIQKYEEWKPMWQNAQTVGQMEYVVNLIPHGEAAFVKAFSDMYYGQWGQAWLADERTVGMRPKNPPPK